MIITELVSWFFSNFESLEQAWENLPQRVPPIPFPDRPGPAGAAGAPGPSLERSAARSSSSRALAVGNKADAG